jgi:hypothetical protein
VELTGLDWSVVPGVEGGNEVSEVLGVAGYLAGFGALGEALVNDDHGLAHLPPGGLNGGTGDRGEQLISQT